MEEAMAARYWCYQCSRMMNPILEAEIKCPYCESGFIEEMNSTMRDSQDSDGDLGSERALSLWAPILLGMMGNSRRRRRLRRFGFEDEDDDTEEGESRHGGDMELDREIDSIIRRRRRSSATILRLLRDARAGIASESEFADVARDRDGDRDMHRERESAQGSGEEGEGNQRNENGRRFNLWSPLSWFSSNSGSHSGGGNSTSSPSGSSSNGREDASS